MPVTSVECISENKAYRVCVQYQPGLIENVVISSTGLYSVMYNRPNGSFNKTGHIRSICFDPKSYRNTYIVFDDSNDSTAQRERIFLYQIQYIKDVTPNNAYEIAKQHGFVGTEDDYLESLRGDTGKSAYEIAVEYGYGGTEEQWLKSLHGMSAYQLAVEGGFTGTEDEYLASLHGADGKSAYEMAVDLGYTGTEEQWIQSLHGKDGLSAYEIAVEHGFKGTEEEWINSIGGDSTYLQTQINELKNHITWIPSMES